MDPESAMAYDPAEVGKEYGILIAVKEEDKDAKWAKDLQESMGGEAAGAVIKEHLGSAAVHCSQY